MIIVSFAWYTAMTELGDIFMNPKIPNIITVLSAFSMTVLTFLFIKFIFKIIK